jgi:FlaA1/EpsC-like NDP-sugar epimerase
LNGQPIFSPDDLSELIESKGVTHVLLAIPSASRCCRNEILNKICQFPLAVRTLPGMSDLAEGRVTVSDLRELDLDDLLGREPVAPNHILLAKNTTGKVVLVTGAGGSIGSELCRQIIKLKPVKLLLVEINEHALYSIQDELIASMQLAASGLPVNSLPNPPSGIVEAATIGGRSENMVVPLLGSVVDEKRMWEIMDTWRPDTVYHAAAYKHVPLVERNLAEGVKNNVIGTLVTAEVAAEKGVSDFVLISTDKAMEPSNVMEASKRLAEMCLQALWARQVGSQRTGIGCEKGKNTKFSMVRFGSMLGSSGLVIPKFRQQIRNGGPITLPHPEINRLFMTVPEVAQLVIQAGALAKGGDVFVLDMGNPVKIMDLARRMVKFSGLAVRDDDNPEGDIEISITGLRPGEKLYEEQLIGSDVQLTQHARIQRTQDPFIPWGELEADLNTLRIVLGHNDVDIILSLLSTLVSGYQPSGKIVDWIYSEQVASMESAAGSSDNDD